MREPMKSLVELQKLDLEMSRLGQEEQAAESELASDQKALDEAQASLAATEDDVKRLQLVVDKRNGDLAALEELLAKLEGQKMTLKTNADYAAMQHQIDGRQEERGQLEERVLEAMEVVDQGKAQLPARKQELEQKQAALDRARARVLARQEGIRQEIQKHQAHWNEIGSGVLDGAMKRYLTIRDHRAGLGLVLLSADNKCQGCFMTVRVQVMNDLIKGSIQTCPHCSRLLYCEA